MTPSRVGAFTVSPAEAYIPPGRVSVDDTCVPKTLNPSVMVMKSAQDGT